MIVQSSIDEISITEQKLHIAVSVHCDIYDYNVHSPKVSLIFETEEDMRRIPLPIGFYEPTQDGCRIFGSYTYFLQNIFWNITWDTCRLSVCVEYGRDIFSEVPLRLNCKVPEDSEDDIDIQKNFIQIKLHEGIDCRSPKNPSFIEVAVSSIGHLITGFIGILLLPWFAIDSLLIMFSHTETKNTTIDGPFWKQFFMYIGWRYFGFCRNSSGVTGAKTALLKFSFFFFNAIHRRKKKLLFLSSRRTDLSGNFEFVYEQIKNTDKGKDCIFWMDTRETKEISILKLFRLGRYLAEAKIILVDDYTPILNQFKIDPQTKIIQLWHACGAFKEFGFSRLMKKGGPKQSTITHRYYDYAMVSSASIAPYYAEGFGIALKKVLPLGVPRTDVFFDKNYALSIRQKFYEEYPGLKGKRVILFAPTFRGTGKLTAYYDRDKFNPNKVIEAMPEDTVLIIKHHPFVEMTYDIKEENKDRVYDFSGESEINDLLFITDVLITDYSSVIFEASLLNIPMVFYAYDLREYIATRDVYPEYAMFVPGDIVETQEELIQALKHVKPDQEKMDEFKKGNFEYLDGNSSRRVADKIMSLMDE